MGTILGLPTGDKVILAFSGGQPRCSISCSAQKLFLTTKNISVPNVRRAEAVNLWCRFTVKIKLIGMHVFSFVLNINILLRQRTPVTWLLPRQQPFCCGCSSPNGSRLFMFLSSQSISLPNRMPYLRVFPVHYFTCWLSLVTKFSHINAPGVTELNVFHFISLVKPNAKMECVSMLQ